RSCAGAPATRLARTLLARLARLTVARIITLAGVRGARCPTEEARQLGVEVIAGRRAELLHVAKRVIEIARPRRHVRVSPDLVACAATVAVLHRPEQVGGIAQSSRPQVEAHETTEDLLARTTAGSAAPNRLGERAAVGQVRGSRLFSDHVDPPLDERQGGLQAVQGPGLCRARCRGEE